MFLSQSEFMPEDLKVTFMLVIKSIPSPVIIKPNSYANINVLIKPGLTEENETCIRRVTTRQVTLVPLQKPSILQFFTQFLIKGIIEFFSPGL